MQKLWRLVRPAWAMVIIMALGVVARAAGWHVAASWDRDDASLKQAAMAVAWDVLLVYAAFVIARVIAVSSANHPLQRPLRSAIPTLLAGGWLLRFADLGHCYFAQCHWTAEAFLYFDLTFLPSIQPYVPVLVGLVVCAVAGLVFVLTLRDARAAIENHPEQRASGIPALLIAAGIALTAAAGPLFDAIHGPEDVYAMRLVPEINFALQWQSWRDQAGPLEAVDPLAPDLRKRLHDRGLVPADDVVPGYPLVRPELDEPPFPYPPQAATTTTATTTPGSTADTPNVIITVVESLNRLFIHELSGHYRGVMPNLSALARRMTRVDGFYNTASPTIAGLVGMLCSIHPPSHPTELKPREKDAGATAFTCLPDVLRAHGYRTVVIQGTDKEATGIARFFRTHGVDELHGRAEIEARYKDRKHGPWGAYDHTLIDYVQSEYSRLERLRAADGRPFMLLFITTDTHDPGVAPDDCRLPTRPDGSWAVDGVPDDEAPRRLLASYHCADKELGRFAAFLDDNARWRDTMWLLTADHSAYRTLASRPLFAKVKGDTGWTFAPVPLLIHDPRHRLPRRVDTLAGTLDVAPTVLHMLGLKAGRNSFTGHSVFGRRRDHKMLIGRVGGRLVFLHSGTTWREIPVSALDKACAEKERLLHHGPEPISACDLRAWVRWQDQLWRARRLYPATMYWGTTEPPSAAD